MGFEHRLRARFQDVDAAGIVFFGTFFDYAHEAFEEWLRADARPLAEILGEGVIGMPLVHVDADYAAPARHDDPLVVALAGIDLGQRSARFTWRIAAEASGTPVAQVRMTHTCVDMGAFKSRPWPEEMRTALERPGPAPDETEKSEPRTKRAQKSESRRKRAQKK